MGSFEYKVSSMCYDAVSKTAPPYVSDLLHLYIPSRSLRSSADTRTSRVPNRKKRFQGQRTLLHPGPVTWNKLPCSVRYAANKISTQNHTIPLTPWANSEPHYTSHTMNQLRTTLYLSHHGPTLNHTIPLTPWNNSEPHNTSHTMD